MKTYLVGGAVRDQMMGNPVSDMDYVIVGATHEDMIAAGYERVGADFPVYLHPTSKNEYALARTERKSGKGYLGFEVNFDPTITLEQDLERRDLTINSIAVNVTGFLKNEMPPLDNLTGVIDPFNGVQDLKNKVLRHTSAAFAEDPLRVIRLARFYARFEDFTIADETIKLAIELVDSGELEHLSRERFWSEMEKCFKQTHRLDRFFAALDIFGVMDGVSFFRDVFGSPWCMQQSFAVPSLMERIRYVPIEQQVAQFVALIANENAEQSSQVIPTRVKRLTQHVRAVRAMKIGNKAEKILALMKQTRAFNEGSTWAEMWQAIEMGERAGENFPVTGRQLLLAHMYAQRVSADRYFDLQGADIGRAMDKERLQEIGKMV